MSAVTCSSCRASNSPELVYCSGCGALLERGVSSGSSSSVAALATRGSLRVAAVGGEPLSLFHRIKGLVIYLFWVAVGVVAVLASMDPENIQSQEPRISDAEGVIQRVLASSRFTPSNLSQQVVNSVLSRQAPFSPESPVRLLPMPVWDQARVQFLQGEVTAHVAVSLFGLPFRISETFRPQGGPGLWSLQPVSATVGFLHLPDILVAGVTPLIRPGFFSLSKDLESLSGARNLVIRPGQIEFTFR
jgi:hypothetical protein